MRFWERYKLWRVVHRPIKSLVLVLICREDDPTYKDLKFLKAVKNEKD